MGVGGGSSGGPAAGILLLGGSTADITDSQLVTGNAGNGSKPIRGIGGWSSGIFVDGNSSLLNHTNTSCQLDVAGNNAYVASEVGSP